MTPFNEVTLLVTHYNRSSSLERLLVNFKDLGFEFGNIVVSDDGSKTEHLERLKELSKTYSFDLVTTQKNKGLGNNINKGQDAVKTEYTLYVQEDFIPLELFKDKFPIALNLLKDHKDYDMARFYAYFKYPFLKPLHSGFSEMIFSIWPWYTGYKKFYYYSDHPHLRRTNFFSKFGRYVENTPVERTEYRMMMSFIKKKGKAIFYDDFQSLFEQANSSAEPSTVKRNFWRESGNPLIGLARHTYRYIRFNLDTIF